MTATATKMVREFRLPDLGEGLTESEIVQWHVREGDTVELNQIIADVETAKAVVELPSPYAGVVVRLYEAAGTTVDVGAPIISFEVPGELDDGVAPSSHIDDGDISRSRPEDAGAGVQARREPNLVGYGAAVEKGGRPQRRSRNLPQLPAASLAAPGPHEPAMSVSVSDPGPVVAPVPPAAPALPIGASLVVDEPPGDVVRGERPRSTPPVRKLARDLGITLDGLTGTGIDALITRADVLAALAGAVGTAAPAGRTDAPAVAPADTTVVATADAIAGITGGTGLGSPGSTSPGGSTRSPIKGMRKHTAAAMVASAFTAPHVTEFLTVDVTPTMDLLAALKASRAYETTKITPLAIVAKAVCLAVRRNPTLNSSWDEQAQEIVQYGDVNLGIAAATPRGLLVPNIKAAQTLPLAELARALGSLTETARAGRTPPADLSGGTISITNIGVFGIDAGTPILNPGEAAILAMGAVRRTPWEFQDTVALRSVMTLSLSFDHRLVDGEQGSRFLADVGTILSNPAMVLTMV